jgi:hypothetical protein
MGGSFVIYNVTRFLENYRFLLHYLQEFMVDLKEFSDQFFIGFYARNICKKKSS